MAGNLGKILLVICDGMGDRPAPALKGKTPLQAAKKPALDKLAAEGACGIMDPIGPGIRPGSDTAHLALLGYDPYKVYTGRGPFEALGVGMDVECGDVSLRCNFSTVDENMVVTDRRAGRIGEGTQELEKAIDGMNIGGVSVKFKAAVEHRAVLLLRDRKYPLSADVTDCDPHSEGLRVAKCAPTQSAKTEDELEAAQFTANVINDFVAKSYEVLKNHPVNQKRIKEGKPPANIILPRGAGIAPFIDPLEKKYGLKSSCVAGITLVRGICRFVGMKIVEVPGATGTADTDIKAKFDAALRELDTKDFVLVNIKAMDLFGHDDDAKGKAAFAQKIDAHCKRLMSSVNDGTIIAITADHSTPCSVRDHSGDPVPLAVWGNGVRPDCVRSFDEVSCAQGALGRIRGSDLMPILLDLANRGEKFGA